MFKRISTLGVACALAISIMCGTASAASVPFADVPVGSPYYTEIMYCRDNGITAGVGNNMFAPNNAVSNFEATTMVVRAFCSDKLADGSSAMDVSFFNGWIENWNYNNPYGQITLSDLINLSLRAKGLYNYCGDAMETAIDMKLYAAGENGARVAKRSDCAYLIGKLAVNTYTPDWSKLSDKLNVYTDSGYEAGLARACAAMSYLPEVVADKWDSDNKCVKIGYESLKKHGGVDPWTTGYTGVYYGDGIAVMGARSIAHEIGHYVHDVTKFKDLNVKLDACLTKYKDIVREEFGRYFTSNRGELFAECFSVYVGQPGLEDGRRVLKEKMPDMFNLLADMEVANWGM